MCMIKCFYNSEKPFIKTFITVSILFVLVSSLTIPIAYGTGQPELPFVIFSSLPSPTQHPLDDLVSLSAALPALFSPAVCLLFGLHPNG